MHRSWHVVSQKRANSQRNHSLERARIPLMSLSTLLGQYDRKDLRHGWIP